MSSPWVGVILAWRQEIRFQPAARAVLLSVATTLFWKIMNIACGSPLLTSQILEELETLWRTVAPKQRSSFSTSSPPQYLGAATPLIRSYWSQCRSYPCCPAGKNVLESRGENGACGEERACELRKCHRWLWLNLHFISLVENDCWKLYNSWIEREFIQLCNFNPFRWTWDVAGLLGKFSRSEKFSLVPPNFGTGKSYLQSLLRCNHSEQNTVLLQNSSRPSLVGRTSITF